MFQVDLLPMKTIRCGSGDEELLVLRLHVISSGLFRSSVIISLAVIGCVPQNASKFSKIIATRLSKTFQEVTLTITKGDRNHDGS